MGIIKNFIILYIVANTPIISFLGAFFGGEQIILFLSILSGQELISFWKVFIFCNLGAIASDCAWFFIGRTALADKLISHKYLYKGYNKVKKIIARHHKNDFLTLLIAKFVYGIRIITIIYFSRKKHNFIRFLKYNSIAVVILLTILTTIGYLAGKGITIFVNIFDDFTYAIKLVVVSIVVFYILKRIFDKWVAKEERV